jgi:hypothetical protein
MLLRSSLGEVSVVEINMRPVLGGHRCPYCSSTNTKEKERRVKVVGASGSGTIVLRSYSFLPVGKGMVVPEQGLTPLARAGPQPVDWIFGLRDHCRDCNSDYRTDSFRFLAGYHESELEEAAVPLSASGAMSASFFFDREITTAMEVMHDAIRSSKQAAKHDEALALRYSKMHLNYRYRVLRAVHQRRSRSSGSAAVHATGGSNFPACPAREELGFISPSPG